MIKAWALQCACGRLMCKYSVGVLFGASDAIPLIYKTKPDENNKRINPENAYCPKRCGASPSNKPKAEAIYIFTEQEAKEKGFIK